MEDADAAGWSQIAAPWSRLWGGFARPAQEAIARAAGVGPGTRVLDVGCGGGEFLTMLASLGADATGVDPAAGMRALAAAAGHEICPGDAEHLPFADAEFEVVTAVNSLHLAADTAAALRELTRLLRPGGRLAVANWAEAARNDVDAIERAVAEADESDPHPDGPLRAAGGLEAAFAAAGLSVAASGIADAPWRATDDETLVQGLLLGEDPAFVDELRPVVLAAAIPFRDGEGYVLRGALRWAVGVVA